MEIKPFDKENVPITTESMPITTVGAYRKVAKKLEVMTDDAELSLEFILTAFFPHVWHNMVKYTNDCYMQGYLAGRKEVIDADQGN